SIRGLGFLLGLEFRQKASDIHKELLNRRIITGTSSDPHVLRLLPPLCLQRQEMDFLVNALRDIFESAPLAVANVYTVSSGRQSRRKNCGWGRVACPGQRSAPIQRGVNCKLSGGKPPFPTCN